MSKNQETPKIPLPKGWKQHVRSAVLHVIEFLGGPRTVLLAHNAAFDLSFLQFAAASAGMDLLPNPILDTLDLSKKYMCGARTFRLEDLVTHLGIAESEDRRALSDSRLAMGLFLAIISRVPCLRMLHDLFDLSSPLTSLSGFHTSLPSTRRRFGLT